MSDDTYDAINGIHAGLRSIEMRLAVKADAVALNKRVAELEAQIQQLSDRLFAVEYNSAAEAESDTSELLNTVRENKARASRFMDASTTVERGV